MRFAALCLLLFATSSIGHTQTVDQLQTLEAQRQLLQAMATHERQAQAHQGHFSYMSKERSERTGGHLWTEKVGESKTGRVRLLIAEDELPLSAERMKAEHDRLAYLAAHPDIVEKEEISRLKDEAKAQDILDLLARGFLFHNVRSHGGYIAMDFSPDPAYSTNGLEERIYHAMNGTVMVMPGSMRMHLLNAHLDQDMSIGFGILATIHAGSTVTSQRNEEAPGEWKTTDLETRVNGRAIFFKTISRQDRYNRAEYRKVADDLTVADMVEMLER